MINDLEFMSDPSQWPSNTCALKRYPPLEKNSPTPDEFAQLTYVNGIYTFHHPGRDRRSGGHSLLVELVADGWLVD